MQASGTIPNIMPKPGVSSAVFLGGKLLLVKRGKPPFAGLWSLPGGAIEPGEEALAAARREVYEETAIAARLLGVSSVADVIIKGDGGELVSHHVLIVFAGIAESAAARAGSDAAAAEWAELTRLETIPLLPGIIRHVHQARDFLKGILDGETGHSK